MRACLRALSVLAFGPVLCFPGLLAAQDAASASATTPQTAAVPAPKAAAEDKSKAKKVEYTGPMTVVELPPAPMLDEEGKQRLDPDGKPMFNPPVRQQRDRKGHPLFDEAGKPVMQTAKDFGYDEHGKKIKEKKEKPAKMVPVTFVAGVMTVDGYTGKAALNYDIADLKYIYLYAPGIGTAVVSNAPFAGATPQANAFSDKTLTVTVEGHTIQVASEKSLLGKKKKPEAAYVLVDRAFALPSKFPVMGYGATTKAPYAWPGAKPGQEVAGPVKPPPLPKNILPVQLLAPCPAGQMRMAGPAVLPGQTAPVQPCVLISKPVATVTAAGKTDSRQ